MNEIIPMNGAFQFEINYNQDSKLSIFQTESNFIDHFATNFEIFVFWYFYFFKIKDRIVKLKQPEGINVPIID